MNEGMKRITKLYFTFVTAFVLMIFPPIQGNAFEGTKKDTRFVKGQIIYQQKKNGTLSVCGFKKGITTAHIAGTINGRKVATINWKAFYRCKTLKHVTIPKSVKAIGGDAFYNCKSLKSISMPNCVKQIGRFAFGGCTSLAEIKIPQSITYISHDAFVGCKKLHDIHIDKDNAVYFSKKGVLFSRDMATLICYPSGKNQSSYTIPKNVKNIGSHAFKQCRQLNRIIIPGNVNNIGGFAFDCCTNLTDITIKDGVKTIDGFAFSGCRALKKIIIPKSITTIGYTIFSGCNEHLKIIYDGPEKKVKWF